MNEPLDHKHGINTAVWSPRFSRRGVTLYSGSNHFDIQGQAHVVPAKAGTPYGCVKMLS